MKLKTVNIKGKEYVEVHERLRYFRSAYPNYSLTSEVIDKTDSSILILASIIDEDGRVLANGLAEEVQNAIANQSTASNTNKNLLTLKVDDNNWKKVLTFVAANKSKGLPWISEQLKVKYKPLSKQVQAELEKHIA
jgi:hypothetical protein